MPTRYIIRLLFADNDHLLQQYVLLDSRKIQQRWLITMRPKEATVHCPSPFKPLPLVARFLKAGDTLENRNTPGPDPPPVPVTVLKLEDSEDKATGSSERLVTLRHETTPPYTDGSKMGNGRSGSAWSIRRARGLEVCTGASVPALFLFSFFSFLCPLISLFPSRRGG